MELDKKAQRALRALSDMDAIEAEGHPIAVLARLRNLGFAEVVSSRRLLGEDQTVTRITEAGRALLKKVVADD